ncbi:hypothetical protein NXY46_28910 [Bacteroides ovatus]|nr:hypothetical protein [Bacteroides ovatus]
MQKHPRQKYRLTDERKRTVDIITGVWWRKRRNNRGITVGFAASTKPTSNTAAKDTLRHICKECRSLPDDVKADMVRCNEVERAVF